MEIKVLELSLTTYAMGWYQDPNTGQYYYYDSTTGRWYVSSLGVLVPLSVPKLSAPKVVNISGGQTLRISYSYKYVGGSLTVTEYASIGRTYLLVYDEKVANSKSRAIGPASTPALYSGTIDLVMPASPDPSWNDIECKVFGGGLELGVNYQDALNVVGVEPQLSEFTIVDYNKV